MLTKWIVTAPTPQGGEQRFNINFSIPNADKEIVRQRICVEAPLGRLRGIDPNKVTLEGPMEPTQSDIVKIASVVGSHAVKAPTPQPAAPSGK